MTAAVIVTFCVLLLIAYFFDLTSSRSRVPSVIFLLLMGYLVRQLTMLLNINLPDFSAILPILGTIGLILIVLEGSLELELNKSKMPVIGKSLLGAFLPLMASAFLLAYMFHKSGGFDFKTSLLNAIPFCIISSAIAIPSVRNLSASRKEFIIYESSLSDIIGVIFFNFIALNRVIDGNSFGEFGIQILIIIIISFIATVLLSFLLSKIDHHIKFVPIILLVILIYEISKIYHLPALVFILFFGLFIGNLDELRFVKWIERLRPEILNKEVHKFKEITVEATFVVRSLFFLLFGYLIETSDILNTSSLIWALIVCVVIYLFRVIQLRLSGLPLKPLLFVAPRGLITILLFLSIDPSVGIGLVNNSLVIQVIIITALVMMVGMMFANDKTSGEKNKTENQGQGQENKTANNSESETGTPGQITSSS
jgi:potassium/hydrogen antiporter